MEDYLEAIAALNKKNGVARVHAIGRLLNVKNSSVSSALGTLTRKGFVIHEKYGYVELTPAGKKAAQEVQKKHDMLFKFLVGVLNINAEVALTDACKMEHSISPRTFKKFSKFIEFVETCPSGERPDWLKGFDYYYKTGKRLKCGAKTVKQKK